MDLPMVFVANQTDAALSLAKHLISGYAKDGNFVFSPPSIHILLRLITAGARGQTLDQLLLFLKSNRVDDLSSLAAHLGQAVLADGASRSGPSLSFVNGACVDRSMRSRRSSGRFLKAGEVVREVNWWVEKETNGLIKDILDDDSVKPYTRFILANAIYFKGARAVKFSASDTQEKDFNLLTGSSVKAPFMTSREMQYLAEFDDFKVLNLAYNQGEDYERLFSMSIFLPNAKDGLPALAHKLVSGSSSFIDEHIPWEQVDVGDFRIPKFKISFGFEASGILKDLGLNSPFSSRDQGFTEMVDSTEGKDLHVSAMYHKSRIEVNEEGTEAAGATVLILQAQCLGATRVVPRIDFVADHPFLFVVRETFSRVVLFIGHVLNPADQGLG
uniref:Serpin domain-containing protein n=1 Tax=Kalanchoe fedtschenkoi TaxID=63787 RepID=A0A7N0TK11_KALFE